MPTKPVKVPQDHRPKAEPRTYRFAWQDSSYELPPPDSAIEKVTGRQLRDAYMDGEEGQMRLGFAMLEQVDADPEALDALYSMPAQAMLSHIEAWMKLRTDEAAATLGESSGSPS